MKLTRTETETEKLLREANKPNLAEIIVKLLSPNKKQYYRTENEKKLELPSFEEVVDKYLPFIRNSSSYTCFDFPIKWFKNIRVYACRRMGDAKNDILNYSFLKIEINTDDYIFDFTEQGYQQCIEKIKEIGNFEEAQDE